MPRGPVIVALGLLGGWVTYGYAAGISALADGLRRRRARAERVHPIVTPLIVLEDAAELGSWVVERRDLVAAVDLGDGLDVEHDLEWWTQQRWLNASLDRVEARPARVIAGMGVGRP